MSRFATFVHAMQQHEPDGAEQHEQSAPHRSRRLLLELDERVRESPGRHAELRNAPLAERRDLRPAAAGATPGANRATAERFMVP